MNSFELSKIRTLNGTQHFAFEELCCQLASLEPKQQGDSFYRKGSGADAGVECYICHADGSETGWQAKFFDKLDSGQISQLTESFQQAIKKHPKLICYIVCLPIDLKDGRTGKNKTEGQRWLDWKAARLNEMEEGRDMDIVLWQATDIRERLYRNDPFYAGRMRFFFDETHFSFEWFRQQVRSACDVLGSRYTPQYHVSLPIRQAFLGLSRDAWLEEQRESWIMPLIKKFKNAQSRIQEPHISESDYTNLCNNAEQLIALLSGAFPLTKAYPVTDWLNQIGQLQTNIRNCMTQFWNTAAGKQQDETQKSNRQVALNSLYEFEQVLDDIQGKLNSNVWQLANEQAVLVYGEAGSGKSHLLADVAADAVKKGYPAIFLITSQFFLQDPRSQILERLDLRHIDFSTFLGALDAAGQAAKVRALLIIDALNERHGIELWREYLASLITEVKRYPHLALIVSCRSTYLDFVILPDSPLHNSLTRIEHQGFADGGGYAARAYLAKRKIVRPSVPNLLPEFNNPLFLKTLCDSLDKQGLNAFPRGIQGLTQYFDFYLQALSKNIEGRMGLDKRQNIIGRALTKFTEQLLERQFSYLPLPETIVCFDAVFPSMGQQNRSLLSELEHEGIVTVEPVYINDGQSEEQVRFTFERFSDFQIAGHLLKQHIAAGSRFETLETNTPLHDFLVRKHIYQVAGIIEALAVLLPETTEFELPEILSSENQLDDWIYERAFLKSLLLRRQDRFTDKTRKWVIDLSTDHANYWLTTLVAISTEPENCFNAHYLHEKLAPLAMPERDAKWSIEVLASSDYDDDSPLDVLISWALESGFNDIEPKRAELAAILLTWLFSVSNRKVRDNATKALSALLAPRLPLAISLMERFKSIDDLYILERLLAASYGAAMQAITQEKLGELAHYVYQWLFADGKPPTHLLLRDYARGIIEYALHCGLLSQDVAIEKARPPYYSDWPIEFVAEADLEKYGDAYRDHIVQSVTGWLGDFGNKIIEATINNWSSSSLKLGKALTPQQNFDIFVSMLADLGASEQFAAFIKLCEFCMDCWQQKYQENNDSEFDDDASFSISHKIISSTDDDRQRKEQNEEKFYALEKEFMSLLDNTGKFHYWTSARHGLMELMNHYTSENSETFDAQLAKYWVTKRAHDFGWNHDLFGAFDERIGTGRGRSNKHIERIGKKYQWLALYELLARIADNLIYVSGYSDDPADYDGPWQIGERNIDPSLLIDKTQDDGWAKHPAVWWSPQAPKLSLLNRQQQQLWLHNDKDQLNSASLLDVIDPETEQRWLVLKGFKHYSTPYDVGSHIDTWCRIWCVVVKKPHKNQFINAISKHTLIDSHALPDIGNFYDGLIGEYPWHPSYTLENNWTKTDRDYGFRYKLLPTVAEYHAEKSGYDYSLEGNINVFLPAPWLIEKLGLRLIDGRTLEYADATGRTLFKDPSVHEEGPSAALIDRTAFLDLLSKENLVPVWIIAGEKGAYGEQHDDFIGRRVHSFIYALNNENKIICVEQTINMEER